MFFPSLQDFLRQNNTGKLLWQVFGIQAATLCLYGITEHEDMMWDALKLAGFHLFLNFFTNLTLYHDEIAVEYVQAWVLKPSESAHNLRMIP